MELIKQIEKKIKEIIALIQTRKEELSTYESNLLELTQQLENIKQQEDMKLELAGKVSESVRKENESLQNQRTELVKETEDLVQQLNKHKSKLNDPNATEEEKKQANKMIPIIQSQLGDKESKITDLN